MSTLLNQMETKRQQAWAQAKEILSHAKNEGRDLTAEEEEAYQRASADLDALDLRVKELQEQDQRQRDSEAAMARLGIQPRATLVDAELDATIRHRALSRSMEPITVAPQQRRSGWQPGLERRELATLSGGQLQRVMLARALAGAPQLLVLDEPTQGLDQPGTAAFYRLIEDLRREIGCAVLSVSHDLHVVMSASDRVVCLNGHVCCEGTPSVVSNAPEYRALFGLGSQGALALYQHHHDHGADHPDHPHDHEVCDHDH